MDLSFMSHRHLVSSSWPLAAQPACRVCSSRMSIGRQHVVKRPLKGAAKGAMFQRRRMPYHAVQPRRPCAAARAAEEVHIGSP